MAQQLPKYTCHKEVQAVKIHSIEWDSIRQVYVIQAVEPGIDPILVTRTWQDKAGAKKGGYFVRYVDGYESYSPAKAFEEGYTLSTDNGNNAAAVPS